MQRQQHLYPATPSSQTHAHAQSQLTHTLAHVHVFSKNGFQQHTHTAFPKYTSRKTLWRVNLSVNCAIFCFQETLLRQRGCQLQLHVGGAVSNLHILLWNLSRNVSNATFHKPLSQASECDVKFLPQTIQNSAKTVSNAKPEDGQRREK